MSPARSKPPAIEVRAKALRANPNDAGLGGAVRIGRIEFKGHDAWVAIVGTAALHQAFVDI